ncbi:MAG: 30S ribosomal protein S8 [Chloroflexi bacterium]|nr:30S ribosomal protein S8 [Chloroflexota bacterium]MCL5275634.1 30S ribosomal protein S8 [Chloroflexota bacterium]
MNNDSISDMLTRIRNGAAVGHQTVAVPATRLTERVAAILKEEGYLDEYAILDAGPYPTLSLTLRYSGQRRERKPVITGLQRISKPGRRVYCGKDEIPRVLSGMGIAVLSTPKGVMTGNQARRLGVGGEVLCYIY